MLSKSLVLLRMQNLAVPQETTLRDCAAANALSYLRGTLLGNFTLFSPIPHPLLLFPLRYHRRHDRQRSRWRRRPISSPRSLQSLIQRLERQSPPPLRLLSLPAPSTTARGRRTRQPFAPGTGLLVAALDLVFGERGTEFQCYESVEDGVCGRGDGRVDDVRPEVGEGEGFGGVAAEDDGAGGGRGRGRGAGEVWLGLVEAEVGPAGEEAEPREEGGGGGGEKEAGEGVCGEEDGGEVLDADLDEAPEDGDGVLGD